MKTITTLFTGSRSFVAVLALLSMSACSTVSVEKIKTKADKALDTIGTKTNIGQNPRDPLEGFNRAMFDFNDAIDQAVLKPVAQVYANVTPSFVQTGVGNFFGNIGDIYTALNNLLQGKVGDGSSDIMRVALNSTFGLAGLLDIGSPAGLSKHKEDFGQTLGVWGVRSGPYLVLPVLGPTTVRDAVATPLDYYGDAWSYYKPVYIRNTGSLVRLVDKRASVLDAGSLIEEAALDRYVFIRDAYLQRRASQINPNQD
ncbi:VacJ family lipoprotein [Undibacterium sp. CCC3.4]|uniref:MlaA family lipoprotein n=1 Tax=unclassified Undibacterium TaxID=2630295 RepID=UPI003A0FD7E6